MHSNIKITTAMVDTGLSTVLGLPGLFVSCVQCFEYIQYSRNIEKDCEDLVIKLRYIGLALTRWGESMGFGDDREPIHDSELLEECRVYFNRIMVRFEDARTRSNRFKKNAPDERGRITGEPDSQTQGLSQKLKDFMKRYTTKYAAKYRNGVNTFKWAVYDKKTLELLVASLRADFEDLKNLFPADTISIREQRLLRSEASGLDDDSLMLMHGLACENDDEAMKAVLEAEVTSRKSRGHVYDGFDIEGSNGLIFRAGDEIARGSIPRGQGHYYRNITIRGSGSINAGDKYH